MAISFRLIRKKYAFVLQQAFLACLVVCLATGCDEDAPMGGGGATELTVTFEESDEGWTGDFVDYPLTDTPEQLELAFERRALPDEVGDGMGLYLAGLNTPDDLFMYLRHQVTDLEPDTRYAVTYVLDIASNAPSGCAGIGGAPGEAVVVKVGASLEEPVPVEGDQERYRLSVDKDSQEGPPSSESSVRQIGNIANGDETCTDEVPYRMIMLDNTDAPLDVTTDERGALWLFVGTDSGFEGKTALYYDAIQVTLDPQ